MRNLEPQIYRQRLTIEGKYQSVITEETIKSFLIDFAQYLGMTPLTEPFIFTPNNTGHPIHHGVAGFMAWAESGCSIYTWDKFNFFTVEIYTCKQFDNEKASHYVKEYFNCSDIEMIS
jgi:S-adenosylmethionine decarboxylase